MIEILNYSAAILTIILSFAGLLQIIKKIYEKLRRFVTWRQIEKWINKLLIDIVNRDNFSPEFIMPMGRGGAVIAAIMSKIINPKLVIPILMVDRVISKKNEVKHVNILYDILAFKQIPKSVLLVAGMNVTGTTLSKYRNWLIDDVKVKKDQIKSAVLIESTHPICTADYVYKKEAVDPNRLKMPWYREVGADWTNPVEK